MNKNVPVKTFSEHTIKVGLPKAYADNSQNEVLFIDSCEKYFVTNQYII